MVTFKDTPVVNRIGYLLSAGSFVFQLIGFATPFWVDGSGLIRIHYGLWQICIGSFCTSFTMCSNNTRACHQLKGTQAMETLSLILFLVGVVLIALKIFVVQENEGIRKSAGFSCLTAGILDLVGVIMYGTLAPVKYLHFSFAFCVIAAGGGIAGGILSFI